MRFLPLLLFFVSFASAPGPRVRAQTTPLSNDMAGEVQGERSPTPPQERQAGMDKRRALRASSPTKGLAFTNIGPTIMSGRVSELAVNPENPTNFYVAYASGGLWETTDNGTTFTPLFDDQPVLTTGALDVHWPSRTIYLGTGEVNSSRSSYAGNGVYKSTDGGQSWTHLGLDDTHHIGRVIVDPDNPDRVWIAALGHLYGPNAQRGVFLTENGGRAWQKTLFVNDRTGAVDLVRDPRQPDHLYAATWERERRAWDFTESGPGSGIHHSTDGGKSWTHISGPATTFPNGEGTGRIGLALAYDAAGDRHLYASLDNYFRRQAEDTDEETLTKNQLRNMPVESVLRLKTYLLDDFLRTNDFPRDLTAETLKPKLESGELTPLQLVEYLENANAALFDTPVKGFEVYHSTDDGQTWTRTHEDYIDGVYYSYGYYFGQLRVDPSDHRRLYAMGVPIVTSGDGGATWTGANAPNVHADHHDLWINPDRPGHLINGNDGGVNISYDGGQNWIKCNAPPLGQFYDVAVDDHPDGYRVYGGLQDNGTWRGPHDYTPGRGWRQTGEYPYKALFGGDGMQVQVDPRDHETAYVGYQYGNYYRVNPREGTRKYLTPKHELGQRPYRWNWETPILLSPHQPDIFYIGSNHLHRSFNRGDDFETISPDLTHGGKPGDVPYGTLTCIDESPLQFGLLYVGSDDGMIHRSDDGGANWTRLDQSLPQELWVSTVVAGKHEKDLVYATLNGYRYDDFGSYVYRSRDRGKTWEAIGKDLPAESVNVIYEDPANANLLYVGTDHGLYFSMDAGETFTSVPSDFPAVAVHDVAVHAGEKELIIGTHGRSLYRTSVAALQAIAGKDDVSLLLMDPAEKRYSGRWGTTSFFGFGTTESEQHFEVYSSGADAGARLTVSTPDGDVLATRTVDLKRGVNTLTYDLTVDAGAVETLRVYANAKVKEDEKPVSLKPADNGKVYLRPGTYRIAIKANGNSVDKELTIK